MAEGWVHDLSVPSVLVAWFIYCISSLIVLKIRLYRPSAHTMPFPVSIRVISRRSGCLEKL